MATSKLESISVIMQLNSGSDSEGNVITVPVSLGRLNPNNYDQDKALAVTEAVEACLSKPISYVQEVRTSRIRAD